MADSPVGDDILVNGKQLSTLRVVDLKSELDKRGLSKSGSKKELSDRLRASLLEESKSNTQGNQDDCIPNIKMQADAIAENNDFIKEYLAKQQEQYKAQKQEKIRVQEEEELRASTEAEEDFEEEREVEDTSKKKKKRKSASDTNISGGQIDECDKTETNDMAQKIKGSSSPPTDSENTRRRSRRSSAKSHDSSVSHKESPTIVPLKESSNLIDNSGDAAPVESSTATASDSLETNHSKSDVPEIITKLQPDDNKVHIDNFQDKEVNLNSGRVGGGSVEDGLAISSAAHSKLISQRGQVHGDLGKDSEGIKIKAGGILEEKSFKGNVEKVPSSTTGAIECSNISTSANSSEADQQSEANSAVEPVNKVSPDESVNRSDLGVDTMELDISIEEKEMDLVDKEITGSTKKADNADSEETNILIDVKEDKSKDDQPKKVKLNTSQDLDSRESKHESSSSQRHRSSRHSRSDERERDRRIDVRNCKYEDKENKEGSSTERPVRKRKWGSSSSSAPSSKKPSLSISTDSLKNIIPDVKMEDADLENCESSTKDKKICDYHEAAVVAPVESGRNVIPNDSDKTYGNRIKSVSPPRRPVSSILHITNLVRPFTLPQLKEMLSHWGTLQEDTFWIDKIKSKCYVMYQNVDEAKEARQALHGIRWPSSNPKVLRVEFATVEDVEYHKTIENHEVPSANHIDQYDFRAKEQAEKLRREEKKDKDREKEREKRLKGPIREWDRDKIGERSPGEREREKEREREMEREKRKKEREEKEKDMKKKVKEEEEAPSKLLDDLFRKTKATPCIYWLPLTSEQIAEKEELRRQRMAERERRFAEIKKADKDRAEAQRLEREQRRRSDGHPNRSPGRRRT